MSRFSKIDENNIVTNSIIAEQEFIDLGVVGDASNWVEGGNKGQTYDKVNKVFIDPQRFPDWTLDAEFNWQPPIEYPDDGEYYIWNGDTSNWKKLPE